jgi:hypothetical protein
MYVLYMSCYGQPMRMFLWSAVIFYEGKSEQQGWDEVCTEICYKGAGMRQGWFDV